MYKKPFSAYICGVLLLPNVPTPQAIVYLWGNGYIEGLCFSDIHVFNYITLGVQLWDWYIANYSTGFQDIIIYFEIQV